MKEQREILQPGESALYNFIYKFNQTHQMFLPEQNLQLTFFSTDHMSLTGHNPLPAIYRKICHQTVTETISEKQIRQTAYPYVPEEHLADIEKHKAGLASGRRAWYPFTVASEQLDGT